MLEHRFEEFKLTGNLPSPTGVGLAILRITQREDVSLDDLVAVLQTDPTLTGRILKLANCGEMSGQYPATTVRAAAMRLGVRNVRNVSLGFSLLAGNRTGRCKAFDYDDYWSHSLAVAVAAQTIAERRGGPAPSDSFTCGLLSNIGCLALASIHPDDYAGVLERARHQSSERLAELEQECFGTHHRELAAAMLEDWRLPAFFVDAVGFIGSGGSADELRNPNSQRLALTLETARDLARALTIRADATPEEFQEATSRLDRMAERENLDAASLEELWKVLSAAWRTWGDLVQIRAQAHFELDEIRRRGEIRAEAAPSSDAGSATDADEPAHLDSTAPARLRILLVGLGEGVHGTLTDVLGREGHEVAAVDDGQTALTRVLDQAPHVLISAWDTRELDGLELVRTLRMSDVQQNIHAILVGRADQEPRLLEALDSGVDEYLIEPVDARLVRARVRAAQRVVALSGRLHGLMRERELQIRQLAILTRNLEITAMTDPLTGLFNRGSALDRLGREVCAARGANRSLALIMIDIDHFKPVNDAHGHDFGDVVLSEIAKLLRGVLRKSDTLARTSGDGFLAICCLANLETAGKIAERLRAAVHGKVIQQGALRCTVTLSLGVAELNPTDDSAPALIRRAEQRLYLAKDLGRDRAVTTDAEDAARRSA